MSERSWAAAQFEATHATVVPFPDAQQRDSSLVALSRQRAAQLVQKAREEAEQIREQARLQGVQQGLEEGRRQLEQMLASLKDESQADLRAQVAKIHDHFQSELQQTKDQLKTMLSQLVIKASQRAWAQLLQDHPETLQSAIDETLGPYLQGEEPVQLWLHPSQLDRMKAPQGVDVRCESSLGEHEFLVRGTSGSVQGSLNSRIQQLADCLGVSAA
jgi:flagellar biosynthesis/type III secretory pathway protein FliH